MHCSSIVKYIYIFYSTFPEISLSFLSLFLFSSPSSFSLSHLLSPLFRAKHHPPPNISNNNNDNSFLCPLSQPNSNSNSAATTTMTTTQFLAILHYAMSCVVPQQTLAKIKISFNILQILVRDHQCLGPVLLGFWVAQIGDGFGGDRRGSLRGHGEVLLWIGVDPMGFAMDFDGHHRTSQSCPSPI